MGLWVLTLMTVFWRQESRIDDPRVRTFADEAVRVSEITGNSPLRSLRMSNLEDHWQFNEEFRIYFGRLIPRIDPRDVAAWVGGLDEETFIVARPNQDAARLLQRLGFERIDQVHIDRNEVQDLWRLPPK
jgi:hypothetical protein